MRAINSGIMKKLNRSMVLDCIRRAPISRAGIAVQTQLTRASVTQIVDDLMRDGLVTEHSAISSSGPGRKQMQLALVQDAMILAGVDLNSDVYELGLMNLGGKVLFSDGGIVAGRSVEDVLDEIAQKLKTAVEKLDSAMHRMYAVGVTAPGPLDVAAGKINNPPCFPAWHNVPVVEMLKKRLGWDVYLGNFSNALALDELYFGIGMQGVEDFMVLYVDECVSTGFVLDGRLFCSKRGFAPEIGHISLKREGPLCACGNRGCLEMYLSFPRVLEGTHFASWKDVIDCLDTDPAAGKMLDNIAKALSFEIVNITNVLYLDRVVLSGDYVYGGNRLAQAINREIKGKSLHQLDGNQVIPGKEVNMVRIAAMPAYHSLFEF